MFLFDDADADGDGDGDVKKEIPFKHFPSSSLDDEMIKMMPVMIMMYRNVCLNENDNQKKNKKYYAHPFDMLALGIFPFWTIY